MRKSKVYSISDEEFCRLVSESNSYSDILRALGLGTNGGSSTDILKKKIESLVSIKVVKNLTFLQFYDIIITEDEERV